MTNGWVKLPRSLLESCVLRQPDILQVFIFALLRARFKETVVSVNSHTVVLEPGQCVFSRTVWSYELHISQGAAYRALRKLEESGLIKTRSTTKYTVITIVGWEDFASSDPRQDIEQQNDNKTTAQTSENREVNGNLRQQNEQQNDNKTTLKKKDNNINNNIYNSAFEEFWERYPNRFNKQQTHKNFVKAAKAHGADAILSALDRYRAEIEAKGTAAEYIVKSTNFVGQKAYYLGYLEDEDARADETDIVPLYEDVAARIAKEWGYE